MTTGELINLITSDSYWKYFNAYFPGSKEIIRNKLEEISAVRNALAHFRPIKKNDLDLIKQNARHTLSVIEAHLVDLMSCADIVPTNTIEQWYQELRILGSDNVSLSFFQSEDEKWVRIVFKYNCPILHTQGYKKYFQYRVLNLITPAILQVFPELCSLLIFLYEQVEYPTVTEENMLFNKSISMVFNRSIIKSEYSTIKDQLERVLLMISEETGLLQEDNLARGKLVQAVDASASLVTRADKSTYWQIKYDNLSCKVSENDPPEYWGQMSYIDADYITSTSEYPWMPVEVSEDKIPF
jgi:hypothetical protein